MGSGIGGGGGADHFGRGTIPRTWCSSNLRGGVAGSRSSWCRALGSHDGAYGSRSSESVALRAGNVRWCRGEPKRRGQGRGGADLGCRLGSGVWRPVGVAAVPGGGAARAWGPVGRWGRVAVGGGGGGAGGGGGPGGGDVGDGGAWGGGGRGGGGCCAGDACGGSAANIPSGSPGVLVG